MDVIEIKKLSSRGEEELNANLNDSLWEEIISGTKTFGFSIKINIPEPLKKNIKEICNGKTCFTEIRDAKFIEFSITDSPANPEAYFEVISK